MTHVAMIECVGNSSRIDISCTDGEIEEALRALIRSSRDRSADQLKKFLLDAGYVHRASSIGDDGDRQSLEQHYYMKSTESAATSK